MIFTTKINGIPCLCEVTFHQKASPMRVTGTGFGDAEPPEYEEPERPFGASAPRFWGLVNLDRLAHGYFTVSVLAAVRPKTSG